jgi:hypothetical protein
MGNTSFLLVGEHTETMVYLPSWFLAPLLPEIPRLFREGGLLLLWLSLLIRPFKVMHLNAHLFYLPLQALVFISQLHILLSEPRILCWELFEHFFLTHSCILLLQLKEKVVYRLSILTAAPMKAERASRER